MVRERLRNWRENRQQRRANNVLKKDENSTIKLVDDSSGRTSNDDSSIDKSEISKLSNEQPKQQQQQQQNNDRPRLRALANTGKTAIQVVLRRNRNNSNDSGHQQSTKQHHEAADEYDEDDPAAPPKQREPKVCPRLALIALHDACSNKSKVQVIKYLVAQHPDRAAATKEGNLPLHTACARKAPASVIEYLLQEYPEGTGVRNKRFKLPIHVALECGASLEVIKLLVKADPDSLQVADYDITSVQFQKVWIAHKANLSMGHKTGLPLHYACKHRATLQTIHFLITEYPDAARTKNKDGWLPVHYSCSRGAPLQHIQYLMTACPSSLYERTLHYYEYPMHLAAGKMSANINVVKYIQSRHSIACTQTKPNEGLYLTYYDEACLQSAPSAVTWFLADVCAKASKGYAFLADAEDPYN